MKTSLVLLAIVGVLALSNNCQAQSYYNSTQETNRQLHQAEVDRQQRQILQQQYIQTQQLDQMRRDAEFRSNRTHDHSHLHQPVRH